jgi:hypothetical protein
MTVLFFRVVAPCALNSEDGDSMFLRNFCVYLPVYTASRAASSLLVTVPGVLAERLLKSFCPSGRMKAPEHGSEAVPSIAEPC